LSAPTSCDPSTKTIAPHLAGDPADRGDIGSVPGRGLHAAEGDQAGTGVHQSGDVLRLNPAIAERHLADVVAEPGKPSPGKVVGAVLALPDDDVRARFGRTELRGNQPRGRRHAQDQRDIGCAGADQPRHYRAPRRRPALHR